MLFMDLVLIEKLTSKNGKLKKLLNLNLIMINSGIKNLKLKKVNMITIKKKIGMKSKLLKKN